MESLKKARALKASAKLAATEAAEAVCAAEQAQAEQTKTRIKREESALSEQEIGEEKQLENVIGLLLDIKRKRAAAAEAALDAPSTPDKSSNNSAEEEVILDDELTPSVASDDETDEKIYEVDELSSPQKMEPKTLPKGNVSALALDSNDLAAAMQTNSALRRRLCRNLSIDYDDKIDTMESLADTIVAKGDRREVCLGKLPASSCSLTWHDLELAIRGWQPLDYQNSPNAKNKGRDNMLKGAAARAEQRRLEHGGFAGLDAAQAAEICKRARDLSVNRVGLYQEEDPEMYPDGAVYATSDSAKKARDGRLIEIEQTLREEGLLRDEFPGLTTDEAREIIASIKLGGEVVEVEDDDDMKKKKARKLPEKLALLKATPLKKGREAAC